MITRTYRQRLGDITPEGVFKEGRYIVKGFRDILLRINGSWDIFTVVWINKFQLVTSSGASLQLPISSTFYKSYLYQIKAGSISLEFKAWDFLKDANIFVLNR